MTFSSTNHQNGLLKNRDPFNPYRHGRSTAFVMPIRTPVTMSSFSVRAYNAIGGASSGSSLCLMVMPSASQSLPGPEHNARSSCRPRRRRIAGMPWVGCNRADQDRAGRTLLFADEIDAPMDAVGTIDVGEAGRAEHHHVARRRPAERMRGRIGVMISLDLDDDAADAVDQKRRADQIGRDLWTLRAKKRVSAACRGQGRPLRRVSDFEPF